MSSRTRYVDDTLARLDPQARIDELEHQVRVLRELLDRATLRLALYELLIHGKTNF